MVRLSDLKQVREVVGTTGHALGNGAIPPNMVRRVLHLRLRQRGATLSEIYFYENMGATLGATIDRIKFDTPGELLDLPGGPIRENSLPIWNAINRATADSIFVSVDVASVDLFMEYVDDFE